MISEDTQGNESSGSDNLTTTGSEETTSTTEGTESQTSEGSESEVDPATGEPKVKPAYTPNFKFKVLDQEKEIDEWLKPVIKDADTEKKIRDLYERAHGLDHVKGERQRLREQSQTQSAEIQRHAQVVQGVNQMLAKKDYDSLFENVLKIPEDDILFQAKKILDRRNLPPEQKEALEKAKQESLRAQTYEEQNQQLRQSYEQVAVSARTQELDWTLQRPDVSQLVAAYDARAGAPGAFKQAVIERGQYHAYASGKDITPEQAVEEVLKFMGGRQNLIPVEAPQVGIPSASQVSQEKKPVITNIQGRGTSPAKKMIRSIDDLKKRAKELET